MPNPHTSRYTDWFTHAHFGTQLILILLAIGIGWLCAEALRDYLYHLQRRRGKR